ncbi:hypothetical protein NDU88_007247, partial [Pleurodeles waltl]
KYTGSTLYGLCLGGEGWMLVGRGQRSGNMKDCECMCHMARGRDVGHSLRR